MVKARNGAYLAINIAITVAANLIPLIGQKFEVNALIKTTAQKFDPVFTKIALTGQRGAIEIKIGHAIK